jgi:hypothetical protein
MIIYGTVYFADGFCGRGAVILGPRTKVISAMDQKAIRPEVLSPWSSNPKPLEYCASVEDPGKA